MSQPEFVSLWSEKCAGKEKEEIGKKCLVVNIKVIKIYLNVQTILSASKKSEIE